MVSLNAFVLIALFTLLQGANASPARSIHYESNAPGKRQLPANSTAVLKRNCAFWGWYPDDGIVKYGSEGTLQTLAELNTATGTPAFAVGAYAHIDADFYNPADPTTYFNGSEILPFINQALAANATFVASISPIHGYGGFQVNDTNQAVAIANVLRGFVDAGVEVWLRWGHEFNWYTMRGSDATDPTGRPYYSGTAADFVNAWRTTFLVVKAALPTVKFMWCPNVGLMSAIAPFFPGPEYVDSVALDYYTSIDVPPYVYVTLDGLIKETHDVFALPFGKPFYLGETGTRSNSPFDNLNWANTVTSEETCLSMPNYQGAFWFNFVKNGFDHRLAVPGGSSVTSAFVQLMGSGPVAPYYG